MADKITVSLEVVVDPEWIDFCVQYNDLFMYGYCGYWLAGMEHDDTGWLVYEYDIGGDDNPYPIDRKERADIVQAWQQGQPLPNRWYRLDKQAAILAYKHGVEKYGINWYDEGDANTYDYVIQLALLGELVYG